MATKTGVVTREGQWLIVTWTGVTESDTAKAHFFGENYSDMLVNVSGTFGSATVTVAGGFGAEDDPNDLEEQDLVDLTDTAISITAADSAQIKSHYPWMGPEISGGTSQSLNIEFWFLVVPAR